MGPLLSFVRSEKLGFLSATQELTDQTLFQRFEPL
jgi:hypothetical protein